MARGRSVEYTGQTMTEQSNVTELITKELIVGKPKYQVFNIFLAKGMLRVYLDPRPAEVDVPLYLKEEAMTMFEIGYDMHVPVTDLVISPQAFEATLSFNRIPTAIFVPWEVVTAITDMNGVGVYWPLSGEVVTAAKEKPKTEAELKAEKRKLFTVLDGGKK